MLYNCACGGTISIGTKLYNSMSLVELEDMCMASQTGVDNPFYDSVMELGEAIQKDKNSIVDESDDEIEEDMEIDYIDYDEEL